MSKLGNRIRQQRMRLKHQSKIRKAMRELSPSEFVYYPEPPSPGNYDIGTKLLSGDFFREFQVEVKDDISIWDYAYPSESLLDWLHGFDWMDDFAAVQTIEAKRKMKDWSLDWYKRYGRGDGSCWRIDLVGWRVIRLITHASSLISSEDGVASERFYETLGIHIRYLQNSLGHMNDGLPSIVSYVALLFASLSLEQFHEDLDDILESLDEECSELVEQNELYLYSRNPEELSRIFTLLVWADQVCEENDLSVGKYHDNAIDVTGRVLRSLRFADYKLLPVNGGGFGDGQEIDRALAYAQVVGSEVERDVLGFRQIRASAINAYFDNSSPAFGEQHVHAHASTLGLWVAERDHVLFGAGGSAQFQPTRERINAQQTDAHSCLIIAGQSSSELELRKDPEDQYTIGATIQRAARVFDTDYQQDYKSIQLQASHDGYQSRFGFIHQRKLLFDRDGLYFGGLDILKAESTKDQKRAKSVLGGRSMSGLPFQVNFHLGPNIHPQINSKDETVSFQSPSGMTWLFRQEGGKIEIEERQYYTDEQFEPILTKSIILHTRLMDISGYVTWSFQAFETS